MNLALANLTQFIRQRYSGTPAEIAANHVAEAGDKDLRRLLRHHRTKSITDPQELRLRDGFDDLLSFYGLVELGCVTSVFPDPLPDTLRDRARRILDRDAVQTYFKQHYPLRLPDDFHQRLHSKRASISVMRSEGIGPYFELLDMIALLDEDENVDAFLHLLDDYWFGGFSLERFIALLSEPERIGTYLLQPPNKVPARCVHGFRTFLSFCAGFDGMLARLARSSTTRMLVQAFWAASEYWFRVLKDKLRAELGRGVAIIETWCSPADPPTGGTRRSLSLVLNRLATCNYDTVGNSDTVVRKVKRYSNRKLYDTRDCHYVTLQTLAEFVRVGEEIQVTDHQTGRDLTAATLAQIIFEEEKRTPQLPVAGLRQVILKGL